MSENEDLKPGDGNVDDIGDFDDVIEYEMRRTAKKPGSASVLVPKGGFRETRLVKAPKEHRCNPFVEDFIDSVLEDRSKMRSTWKMLW
eukprot:CAMPEP_0182447120 /NCGR_PEP_ID=MMETSP1172-20130603/11644_1 /TAXON_ID=708627 /ORGANISM="Timspurckia oligopyrenoides, Strain CCMP3278" /LENGTH=87 /DNA_ID=CAMNT_0024643433 /DNA_START=127 /DNA_END=387 /DNA_ORIENTATION=+